MKINKFGSIYMRGDELVIDGFAFASEGHEKALTNKGRLLAAVEAINVFMKSKVEENFQLDEIYLIEDPRAAS